MLVGDLIQNIPQIWNQPIQVGKQHELVFGNKD
jgi:hypothetical protein